MANFIPLEKKPEVKSQEQSFPLGNPFRSPLLKARPEFFPPLHYPPLFKTKPAKLEGSFGPRLPPKPEPDVIHFPDEELPGVVREAPRLPQKLPRVDDYIQNQPSYVYKTVRDMDYSRPKDILSVKPSGELYVPDPREAHAPLGGDLQPRVPILPGVSTFEDLENLENQEQEYVDEADDRIWKADFSDVLTPEETPVPSLADVFAAAKPPLDLESSASIRDPVVFREPNDPYKKPGSSFKFPGQSTSDSKRHFIRGGNRKPPPELMDKLEPNYSVIIGLNYDDDTPDVVVKDYEEDFQDDQPYSTDELYELCIKEVPAHLHRELCGYIRDGKPASGIPVTNQLPPKQSRLIQDQPHHLSLQQNSYQEVQAHDPFAGIPTELPVQINKNKNPLVITSNSKVKIYKPFEEAPRFSTTTVTSTTTIKTTTDAPKPQPPILTHTPSPPLPNTPQRNHRPLLFNKRDPNTGETKLSQPFEYFNRLTQFFNNRIQSPQHNSQQRRRPPPPPRLQRQRIRLPPPT